MGLDINFYSTTTKGFKNKILNWFSLFQKIFSWRERKRLKMEIEFEDLPTHMSGDLFLVRKVKYVLEAIGIGVVINEWRKPKWTFQWTAIPEEIQEQAIDIVKSKHLHKKYGYLQILSFIKRYTLSYFIKDTRNIGVPFVGDDICTEIAYWIFYVNCELMKWPEHIKWLEQWNSNIVYPLDGLIFAEYFQDKKVGILKKNY